MPASRFFPAALCGKNSPFSPGKFFRIVCGRMQFMPIHKWVFGFNLAIASVAFFL